VRPTARKGSFRPDINGMRCIAVLAVMFFHLGVPGFPGGFVGVDVFFVISGYLMTGLIHKNLIVDRPFILEFYAARARRILPGLVGLVLPLLILGYFWLIPRDYRGVARDSVATLGFFSNFLSALHSNYFDNASRENWLLHTWSLSVEWQFYLFYPLLLLAGWRLGKAQGLLWVLVGSGIVSLLLSVVFTPAHPTAAFFLLPTRCWEMIGGGLVFLWADPAKSRLWLGICGLAATLVSACLFSEAIYFPSYWALIPVGGAAAVIAANVRTILLTNRITQFLGDISYSLYLWHWPVVMGARYFDVPFTLWTTLALIAGSIALGYLSYRFVETPFREVGRRVPTTAFLARCGIAVLPAIGIALFIYAGNGLPNRVAPETARLVLANQAQMDDWSYPPGCGNYRRHISRDSPPLICQLGETTGQKVLIWGDSHMEQLYGVFQNLELPENHPAAEILFATKGACVPVRGIDRAIAGFDCPDFAEAVYSRAQEADITTVIIGGFWLRAVGSPSSHAGPTICRASALCRPFTSSKEALAFVSDQLIHDVGGLTERGKRVVIILPFPSYPRSVSATLAKQTFWHRNEPFENSFAGYLARTGDITAALRAVAMATHAELLDPAAFICSSGTCAIERDAVALYRDDNHLSPEGAKMLAPLFQQLLAQ
jgi:peptidoglycan/LPS O-acetylase OafA/YrhL